MIPTDMHLQGTYLKLAYPARPGRTFATYESVIRREYLEELRRPLAF